MKHLSIHGQTLQVLKTDLKEPGIEGQEVLASFGLEHKPSDRLLSIHNECLGPVSCGEFFCVTEQL